MHSFPVLIYLTSADFSYCVFPLLIESFSFFLSWLDFQVQEMQTDPIARRELDQKIAEKHARRKSMDGAEEEEKKP